MEIVLVIFIAVVAFLAGGSAINASWRTDCEKAGAHVSDGKVYDCKLREGEGR